LQNTISSKFWYRYYAAYALGAIGTNAASAIPALKKMAGDSEKSLAWIAGAALVLVQGEPLERYISDCLDYTNNIRVGYAFGVLCNLGPYAEAAIPSLLAEIESTNNRVRSRVIHVLGTVGAESETCVQVMIHLLGDEDSLVRSMAADALANYGPMAKRATPFVAKLLDDNEDLCRTSALMFFYRIVESDELEPYRTAVQRMTNDSSQTVRDFAGLVLDGKKP
jgi:HEAT repeat protein